VSAQVHVLEVRTDAELRDFVALPGRLYAGDPGWVAPLRHRLRRRLARRNLDRHRLFLAVLGAQVVGSIGVQWDAAHARIHATPVAFFGFFHCVPERPVAQALLARATAVARGWGADVLRGPRDLSRVEAVGVTVEGHDLPPPFLAGHSSAEAEGMLAMLGFRSHHDVLAYAAPLVVPSPEGPRPAPLPQGLQERAAAVALPGLELRAARWSQLRTDLDLAHRVFVDAFRDVPDNTPMSRAAFMALGGGLLAVTHRSMLQLATVDGRPAGFALCFPEVGEALRHAGGGMGPLDLARVALALPRVRTASFKLLGVLPEFRGTGLHAALVAAAVRGAQGAGYSRLEASLVDARNLRMRAVIEGAGMQVYRRYRVMERRLVVAAAAR
jgi:GNAT superfamily N-acetyltransferase